VNAGKEEAHYGRWFLVAGGIGLLVALILTLLLRNDQIPPALAVALWPTSILGLVDPASLTGQIITGCFTYGGNFLLYGLIGVSVLYMGRKLDPGPR
jgi:hypothetical protein